MTAKKTSSERKRSREVTKKQSKTLQDNTIKIAIALVFVIVVISAVSFILLNQGSNDDDNEENNQYDTINPVAVINTSMGAIEVELYMDKVPNTVDNFIKLANDGFYNGLVFHRVIDDFMIQGGGFNPDGSQKESPYGSINLEISPDVRHVDGAISMARTNDPNSATSQFFICDGAQSGLDDSYAAFGEVIDGMDVVRDIASVDTGTKTTPQGYQMQDWPTSDVFINNITIKNQ